MRTAIGGLLAAAVVAAGPAMGEEQAADGTLERIVVTATRSARIALDVPASVSVITRDEIRDAQWRINLSESLPRVPGVVALNRENSAQDLQISVRGFGARSTFGVRGIRLYLDGIPATQPDGQGQVSHFPLDAAQRIEVLRGPFSALYGNSSGGVIALTTRLDEGLWTPSAAAATGAYGTWRVSAGLAGGADGGAVALDATLFRTGGFREHSAATRSVFNGSARLDGGAAGQWRLNANVLSMPEAQDPLGLTRTQWQADPRQASPQALVFDTRKTVRQQQGGLQWTREDGPSSAAATAWLGRREVQQFLAIPVAAQTAPSSSGGVIDLERDYGGLDARLRRELGAWDLAVGLAWEWLNEQRRGFENFLDDGGRPVLGVQGRLRRDERNTIDSRDPYAQVEWRPDERWRIHAGLRASSVRFVSQDRYLANGDDSGSTRFHGLSPTIGVVRRLGSGSSVYAAYGRGFETPTLNETAYRADGSAGLNTELEPARSNNYEVGLKASAGTGLEISAAIFAIDTRDEIVVLSSSGGRSSFGNAGATTRRGAELALDWRLAPQWALHASATALRARFDQPFLTCAGSPCPQPSVAVAAGNRLPAVPAYAGFAEVRWRPGWAEWRLQWRGQSKLYVDDRNSEAAPGYGTVGLAVIREIRLGGTVAQVSARAENLLDKNHVGAVIVNEANGRYYEPAPGRAWFVGIDLKR